MNRIAVTLVTLAVSGSVLAGCGGDSPYCAAVKENQATLGSFGKAASDAAFAKEARAVRQIAATKPEKVAKDWSAIDRAMRDVQTAQKKTGLTFGDLADSEKRAAADADDVETITKVYSAFNDTVKQRTAVVKDVKTTCDITLK